MATQSGLRSTSEKQPQRVRRKDSRAQPRRARQSSVSLSPSASPVSTYSGAESQVRDNRLGQIADALSGLNPTLERYGVQRTKAKEQEQMEKLRWYADQIIKDKETGAISKTQVKEVFPELVPSVAARVQQSIAELEARRWAEGKMETVLQNDDLRLNTANREAYYQQVYEEARGLVGEEGIYASAFLETLDGQKNSWERQFQVETAAYHEEKQLEAFKAKAADALAMGDTEGLLTIDENFDVSSLNRRERKKAVVETALDMAFDNPSVLDNIPDRFLNKEYKGLIRQKKRQIEDEQVNRRLRQIRLHNAEKAMQETNAVQDLAARVAEGETDINIYKDYPGMDGAYGAMRAILNDVAQSSGVNPNDPAYKMGVDANTELFKSQVYEAATYDDGSSPMQDDPVWQEIDDGSGMSKTNLIKYVSQKAQRGEMAPEVASNIIKDSDEIVEGFNFYNNPDVKNFYRETVGATIDDYASSPNFNISEMFGVELRGKTQETYTKTLKRRVRSYQQENNGSLPKGSALDSIMEEAAGAARNRLNTLLENTGEDASDGSMGDMKISKVEPEYPKGHPKYETQDVWVTLEVDGTPARTKMPLAEYEEFRKQQPDAPEPSPGDNTEGATDSTSEKDESKDDKNTLPGGGRIDDEATPPHLRGQESTPSPDGSFY